MVLKAFKELRIMDFGERTLFILTEAGTLFQNEGSTMKRYQIRMYSWRVLSHAWTSLTRVYVIELQGINLEC